MTSLTYERANNLRYKLIDVELPEGVDRAMFCALLTAGVRGCLEQELDALEDSRNAMKDAALAISQAADWNAVAKRLRDRDAAIRSGAFVERVIT
ncbi:MULTISPECIES: DUF2742 domain-containing protein [Gordonia]|uniref:DUF2742 domain-containing protein n=1 Tax=Gordonia TaxID=2053 RepID=UPI0007E989F5|nr:MULTISPECIES: DUF2742 domain-containing protein [Gordonia]OBA31643.1 DUF2742 domain-containing protein [Gordonia sp. 852002-51296_SCH5728562-b]